MRQSAYSADLTMSSMVTPSVDMTVGSITMSFRFLDNNLNVIITILDNSPNVVITIHDNNPSFRFNILNNITIYDNILEFIILNNSISIYDNDISVYFNIINNCLNGNIIVLDYRPKGILIESNNISRVPAASTLMSSSYMESLSNTSINPSSMVSTTSVTTSQSVITPSQDNSNILSSSADSSLTSLMPSQTSSTILVSLISSDFNSSVSSDLGAVTTSQPLETSVSEVFSASRSVSVNPTPSLSTGSAIDSSLISLFENSSTILPTESGNLTPTTNTDSTSSLSFTSGLLSQTSVISSSTSGSPTLSTDSVTSTESITSTTNGSLSPSSDFVSKSFFSGSSSSDVFTTPATGSSTMLLETISSTFGFLANATSTPTTVQTSSMMDAVSTMIQSSGPANNSTTQSFSSQPITTTQISTPSTMSFENSVIITSQAMSESFNITSSDSSIVTSPVFNLTSTPVGMTDSFVVQTIDGSIVTTPIINFTVSSSETIFSTGTPTSEITLTTKNITSPVEVSSALLTSLQNDTETTSVIGTTVLFSSVMANFSTPVISEFSSLVSNFSSFTEQATVSSFPISSTLASQTDFATTTYSSVVDQTSVLPTVNISSTSAIYSTESLLPGMENASTWTNFPSTDIISLSTQIISTGNLSETIITTTPLMSSLFNASLLVVTSSVGFATDLENNTVSMISSMLSSELVTNQSVSVSLSANVSSVSLSTVSVPTTSEQSTVMPSLSGSLQSSVASWSSQGSDLLLSTSVHEYNTTTVMIEGNQTLQTTTELVSPTVVSNFSSFLSNSQSIASVVSTELNISSTPATTYIEQLVTTSMPNSTANSSLITSVIMSSMVDSESSSTSLNLNISTVSSPVLTMSTTTAPISSMSVYSSSLSELLTSTDILSTPVTSVVETLSTNGLPPVLSRSVMDESSSPLITSVSSISTEVESSIPQTTNIISSETSSITSILTTPSISISSEGLTTDASTVILSSALPSSTPDLSTNIQSTLTAIPDTKTTTLFSSVPVTTEIPVSSVVEASSSTQMVQLSSSVQEVTSVTPSSEISPTLSSSNVTSSPASTEPGLETSLLTPSMSSSLASTSQILTAAVTSLSMESSRIMPSPASSSLPVSTVLQSSSVEVSTSETVTSSISSVVSAVSSTVTTQNPSSSVPVTSTILGPSTSETTTTISVIDTTPSTVTDNTTESSVTTSSVDIETTPSSVPGNTTENSTTAAVPSSTVTTTTTSTTTTTTPRPTTTTPTPTISVNVVRVYWVVTVLKVPLSVDVNNQTFIASMELKLATAYVMAFERQKQIAEGTFEPLRRRRAAQVQDTVVNIVNATRTLGTGNVTFVYNITKNGTEVRSEEAVRTLGLLSDQEMALTLGYVVAEKASTYYGRNSASSVPEETSNLWIVGVAVAAVVIVIIVIWVIFCFIIKKRGPESGKDGEPPHLLRMKGGNKSDESVEMVQSPSNSTHNLKKRQSYEVTKEADLEDPTYAVVKKPGKKMEDSTAGDSATLASDDTGLLPSPSKKGRRKKKKKPASEEFDNIEKESYLGSSAPPHPVREPKSLSVEDETEYQRKVAEERRKNKKRLREKRRREGQKKEDTEDMMKEYLAVQEEIDSVLEAPPQEGEIPEVFKSSTSKGSKKKRRRKGDGEKNEGYEPENLTDAKKRMHKLLDDAFALITPKLDEKNEEEQTPEKKHEPMFINPSYQGSRREGLTTWSPYRAADEVTLISMPKTVLVKPMRRGSAKEVPEDDMERKSHHSKRPAVNLPDPVPKASYTTEPPKPIILRNFTTEKSYSSKRSSDPKPYLQNGFGSREESDIDKLKSSSISQNDSGRVKSANGDLSQKPPIQHQKPFKRTPEGEDMTDIVSKNIHSGETPENTITAVRNELQNIVHPTVVTLSSGGWMGSSSGGMADIA
nr:uncharacterized threonine-rich GPI-anchored glycoprotein PJ4664.02 isoform X4 [Crassostrea gigas]